MVHQRSNSTETDHIGDPNHVGDPNHKKRKKSPEDKYENYLLDNYLLDNCPSDKKKTKYHLSKMLSETHTKDEKTKMDALSPKPLSNKISKQTLDYIKMLPSIPELEQYLDDLNYKVPTIFRHT
jgi:hypothetical protein